MRLLRARIAGVLVASLASCVARARTTAPIPLLERAAEYALRYEERFAVVISDEAYEQHADGRQYHGARDRKIASEMMFVWLAGERTWLSVRNVVSVDGSAVKNSQKRLDRLLSEGGPVGLAHLRRLRDEGARFNIGTIRRNFNDPMFPLQFLEPDNQPRFSFTLAGQETIDGTVASKVLFVERARPTFIRDGGRDLPSQGILWVADDGAVLRTRFEVADSLRGLRALVFVDYRREARLDMLVPVSMHEIYLATSAPAERAECHARYSHFRRFETGARIVPDR
jgi:hypothetical protein